MILDLLLLPSLDQIASASMDRSIRLWDMNSGKHKQTLEGHSKGVRCLAYSSEYRFLVSAGFDYDAMVWNPYVNHLILRLNGHTSSLCGVVIIPDTPQIITADAEGVFKVWDIRNFSCMQTFSAEENRSKLNRAETRGFVSMTPH
jgi:WD40 repeat protein